MNVGDTYHGLTLLAYCGGGAFGEVFYCEDVTHKKMAVKIINKKHLEGQCLRELKGITNYRRIIENNPNLLQIYHVEEDEDTFYYTMEPADSLSNTEYKADTLAARLAKGPIPDAEIYPMLSNIFQGIKALHTAGFAHRDIKPDNILFVNGVPKLADMGLLSSLSMTMSTIAGTLDFIPPEIRTSNNWDAYDSKSRQSSDLYAFGKVIYCAVTGNPPQKYPSVPKKKSTMPFKLFMRLAIQLCDEESARRLCTLSALEKEFVTIDRKLLFGENIADKLSYSAKWLWDNLKAGCTSLFRWSLKHKFMALLILIIIASTVIYLWPKKPFDIATVKNQIYRVPEIGLSMKIPKEWTPVSKQFIEEAIEKNGSANKKYFPNSPNMTQYLREYLDLGCHFILCDYEKPMVDNIVVQQTPIDGKTLEKMSVNDFELLIRKVNRVGLNLDTTIYEIKKMNVAGYPCIRTDASVKPEMYRSLTYCFIRPKNCFSIALTAKNQTFQMQREKFESMLKTVHIDDPK